MQRLLRRLRALFHGADLDRDLANDMQAHIELEAEHLMRADGLDPLEARRRASVAFGGKQRYAEAHRDVRGVEWVLELVRDLRYSARSLARTPTFTVSATLVLALGIGASAAIFSAVNAVLVSHLPYAHDDRLVRVYNANSSANRWSLSVVDYQAVRDQSHLLSAMGAIAPRSVPVAAGGLPATELSTAQTTAGLFDALGIRAAYGRVLVAGDEQQSAPHVVVLSNAFAARAFGSASAALNKIMQIDGSPTTIVGVLAPGVRDLGGLRSEIWPNWQPIAPTRRGPFGLALVARVADGTSVAQAGDELAAISRRIFPIWSKGFGDRTARFVAVPLREAIVGTNAPRTLWLFTAAAALLLLTAVANVANLILARMAARGREMSLRAVLGASRTRLARLIVTETTALSLIAGVFGVGCSVLILHVLIAIAPDMPRLGTASINWSVLVYAFVVALAVGLVVGLHPVLSLSRSGNDRGYQSGQRDVGQSHANTRLRGALVAAEFALAVPLLAGAGLLMQSIGKLQRVNPGFDPARVAYAQISLPKATYANQAQVQSYWQRAVDAAQQLPGVTVAGYSSELPPSGLGNSNDFNLPSHPLPPSGEQPVSPWMAVSAGYFDAMGIKLVSGRMFTAADTLTMEPIVVSESWARHYTPDLPAAGQRIFGGGCKPSTCPTPSYIVGVVSDVKYDGLSGTSDAAYGAAIQGMGRNGYLVVRTARDAAPIVGPLRAALRGIDPAVTTDDVGAMVDRVYESIAQPRHWALLLAAFASSALLLAAIGIFGLLSYLVTTMRREIGVRLALGAERSGIASLVVRRGLVHSVIGAAIGLVLAIGGRRLIAGSLFGVRAADPATLLGVSALLLAVALVACWIPAQVAAGVEPTEAIRGD